MARPKKTVPTVFMNIGIPKDLADKINDKLYSVIEGKVPFGARQEFFTKLLKEHFDVEETTGTACLNELGAVGGGTGA